VTTTADHVPDDQNALKAALIEARAKLSGAEALIAHLQLVIAKMKREAVRPALGAQPAPARSAGTAAGGIGRGGRRGCGRDRDGRHPGAGLHAA